MDKEFFTNGRIQPTQHLDTTMAMPFSGPNESALMNSMVSSSSCMSNDAFALHELIGKLGGAGNFPPYTLTPYDSPHELHLPVPDDVSRGNLVNSVPLTSLSADPGFAEGAAKFSCFGSRSFNGRTAPIGMNNGKLRRVASSPTLKQAGSPLEGKNLFLTQIEVRTNDGSEKNLSKVSGSGATANSNEESSVSEQITSVETKPANNEMSSRTRKWGSRGKTKEDGSNSTKDEDGNAKRSKQTENGKKENVGEKTEEEGKEGCKEKAAEPPKNYIHVRARRGQATDSHSLAERARREKISERMKFLQDLVPGCNKVTGKALMLDEIINYVQSLQRQVEFLSMKLASVNPVLDFNMDNILNKDVVPQRMYHLDSSTEAEAALYINNDQNVQQLIHNSNISSGPLSQCSVDHVSLDAPLCGNVGIQLPSVHVFSAILPEFPAFGEDDLHNIIQMGFGKYPVNFPVPCQFSDMKAEW